MIGIWYNYVGHYFVWLVELRDWYSDVKALGPEYERSIQIGLNNYEYYVCKLLGLSASSGKLDSLQRCTT